MKVTLQESLRMVETAQKLLYSGSDTEGISDKLLYRFEMFASDAVQACEAGDTTKAQHAFDSAQRAEDRIAKIFNDACERGYW